jgi:hypothetical protein
MVTKSDTFAQLNEHLIRCQELCALMAHLLATEDTHMDKLLSKGWLAMSEMFKMTQFKVIEMAKGKLQS